MKINKMFDRNLIEYHITIPLHIMKKLIALDELDKNKTIEYQYYMLCDTKTYDYVYEVQDIWVPYQMSSGTLTEEDLEGDIQRVLEQVKALKDYKVIKCHSHHTMGAFSSGTDIKEAEKSLNLQMVHNHNGDYVVYNHLGRCCAQLNIEEWKPEYQATPQWDICAENLDERLGHKTYKPIKGRLFNKQYARDHFEEEDAEDWYTYMTNNMSKPVKVYESEVTEYDDLLLSDERYIENLEAKYPCGEETFDEALCKTCVDISYCKSL